MHKSVHSREQEVLQEMLREVRKKARLRQEDLAERLQRPRTFVSRYEVGEKMLDLPELRQVLKALGVPFLDFMREYDARLEPEGL
jgi:transcriptional regulator with XRE-family HTH domain